VVAQSVGSVLNAYGIRITLRFSLSTLSLRERKQVVGKRKNYKKDIMGKYYCDYNQFTCLDPDMECEECPESA
jgi:hypothetical protein